jgi:hypothetical protein
MRHRRHTLAKTALFAGLLLVPQLIQAEETGTVYASAEAVVPLAPGAAVPSAIVRTVDGEEVDLADVVRDEGALLVFYRGGW